MSAIVANKQSPITDFVTRAYYISYLALSASSDLSYHANPRRDVSLKGGYVYATNATGLCAGFYAFFMN
jgi:hypothetical protein